MKAILTIIAALFLLAACSTTGDYEAYIKAQAEATRVATEGQKPLVRLTAQPGQPITGLASLEVFMPVSAPVVQQQRPSEWAGVFGQGLSVAGTVMGIKYAGQAASALADNVGKYSTAGYAHVQSPGAVVTTSTVTTVGDNSGANSGNSGRIAGSAMSDSTSTPTVVMQPLPVVVGP